MNIPHIFIGVDPRQHIALQVLMHSIYSRASGPVSITPIILSQIPMKREGLTQFSFSRYLVPYMSGFKGQSIFLDADMLVLGDIYELIEHANNQRGENTGVMPAVSVVKNPLRFEWSSVMVFNNSLCQKLTPEFIDSGVSVMDMTWANDVGSLPSEWNHLVGYDTPRKDAKLVHFTQGIPCFPETQDSEYEKEWMDELKACNSTVSWASIMGNSVHVGPVLKRLAKAA